MTETFCNREQQHHLLWNFDRKFAGWLRVCLYFLSVCLFVWLPHASADTFSKVRVYDDSRHIVLGPYLSYLEDTQGTLEWQQAFEAYRDHAPEVKIHYNDIFNLGIRESIFWLFLEFDFSAVHKHQPWLLELAFPLLETVDVFRVSPSGELLGHQFFYSKQSEISHASLKTTGLVFDLDAESSFVLLIRIDSYALNLLPIHLWSSESLAKHNNFFSYGLGFFFGLMTIIALYSAVISVFLRDRRYFYYLCYLVSVIGFFVIYSGVLLPWFPQVMSFANERLVLTFALFAMAFSLKFVTAFLSLPKISAIHDSLVNLLILVLLVFGLIAIGEFFPMIVLTAMLTPVFASVMFYIIFFARARGAAQANIILSSFMVWLLAALVFVAALFGLIGTSLFTQIVLYLGVVFQVLVLSLALAGKINEDRQKRFQALIRENQAVQDLRRVEERSLERVLLDPLTALPNRSALERLNKDLLENRQGRREPLAVLFVHLQSYYDVSHTLGFRSSDLLIEKAAGRLNRIAAEIDDCIPVQVSNKHRYFVCKLDSASFVVMFRQKEEKSVYVSHAQHILELLNRPIAVHDMHLDVNAVIGMSFSPEHSTNIFTLVRFAQAAVEAEVAHGNNKNVVALYSSIVSQQAARKLKLINDLRTAIKHDELYLVFQPQLDLRERRIVSVEALLRWKHPELGEISPNEFIILAEQTGLIHDVSEWVIENAIDSLLWLMERGLKLHMAINISAKNLAQEGFAQNLFELLEKHKLDPGMITLELTETSLMHNPEQGIRLLREIHERGVVVAIDDFGAGYSSFSFIKQLPLSELKIDRSFVSQVDNLYSDRVITKSSIVMAHELGARVCAEGVESASCLQILEQFECDLVQGFYIARPMPKNDLLVWIGESQFGA